MAKAAIIRNRFGTVEDIVSFSKMPECVARLKEKHKARMANITITIKMQSKTCHCNNPAPGTFADDDLCSCGLSEQHTHCETCGGVWKEGLL